jgi:hypothetical protein
VSRHRAILCECGNPKPSPSWEACARCAYLDGRHRGERAVISAIRGCSEPPTLLEIAEDGGLSRSNAEHILIRMRRRGRVVALRDGKANRFQLVEGAAS